MTITIPPQVCYALKCLTHLSMILSIAATVFFVRMHISEARARYTFKNPPDVTLSVPYPAKKNKNYDPIKTKGYDIHKLAKAVAIHETGNCTAKVGSARYNNCFGWGGSGGFYHFKSPEESYAMFYERWPKNYGEMPDIADATHWVCGFHTRVGDNCDGGSPHGWLSSVNSIYASL